MHSGASGPPSASAGFPQRGPDGCTVGCARIGTRIYGPHSGATGRLESTRNMPTGAGPGQHRISEDVQVILRRQKGQQLRKYRPLLHVLRSLEYHPNLKNDLPTSVGILKVKVPPSDVIRDAVHRALGPQTPKPSSNTDAPQTPGPNTEPAPVGTSSHCKGVPLLGFSTIPLPLPSPRERSDTTDAPPEQTQTPGPNTEPDLPPPVGTSSHCTQGGPAVGFYHSVRPTQPRPPNSQAQGHHRRTARADADAGPKH